jgi:hypothetical protein
MLHKYDGGMFRIFVQFAQTKTGGPGYKVPQNEFFNPLTKSSLKKFDFRPNFLYNIIVEKKIWRYCTSLFYTPRRTFFTTYMANRLHLDFSLTTNIERRDFLDKYLQEKQFVDNPPTEDEL